MASNNSTQINSSDPSVAKQIQRETNSLLRQPTLASAPSVNGSANATITPTSQAIRTLAPIVGATEVVYPQSTAATSNNAVTISSSLNNDTGDITTVYSSNGQITVNPINQTINQYTSVNSGVNGIVAGTGVTITSTGSGGTGVVTINATGGAGNVGNIAVLNLDGNAANVLHGDGTWSADQTTYGNSNVAAYLPTYTGNIGGNVVTANLFAGNGSSLSAIAGANVSGFVPNANVANTAFAVAAANVTGLGNIATINLTGSTSNVLYGNGVFAPASGGGVSSELVNGSNSLVLDGDGNIVLEGTPSGNAINRGLVWDFGANANGVNSTLRQDNGGLTVRAWTENGGGANGYSAPVTIVTNQDAAEKSWEFDGQGNLTVPSGSINSINDGGDLGAYITLTPDTGVAKLAGRTTQSNVNYTNTSWSTATYTGTQIDFTNAPDLVNFFNENDFNDGVNQIFSINGDEPVPFTGYTIGVSNAVTVYTDITAEPDPTTVTSINFYYQLESYVAVDYDDGTLRINATDLDINIDNDQTSGPDINLRSGDDITLQAKDKAVGSESEGGDINIYAGDGADDDGAGSTSSTGGDIQLIAGNGGDGNTSTGSSGGFTTIRGGAGGSAGVTNAAGPGGYVSIVGGDGGTDGGNTSLGGVGGNVSITAGLTRQEGVNGPNVVISSGQAGPNALAGYVDIVTPASANGLGGTWRFDGNGNLTLPNNTFAVNYANGAQVPLGGSGNTGNVTFDDNVVIGTGDEYGADGLFLATGPDGVANLQYLRLRGGDAPTHIHLDTGNNQYYDQYFGDDGKFVKLEATEFGNVVIGTIDIGNNYNWSFTSDGNLILAGGNSVIQSIANSSLDPLNPNVSTMVLTPDPGYSSQSLVLDPTAPGHIHLRAPGANIDEPSANIFLGGEESSFEVGYHNGSAPNLFIHSGGNTWTFDNAGNLAFPRDAAGNSDPYLNIFGGSTPTIQSTDVSLAGPANLAIQADYLNYSGFNGNRIVLHADTGEIGTDANMVLTTNLANTGNTYSWTFGNDGTLTVPFEGLIRSFDDTIVLQSVDTGTGNANSVRLATDGSLYFEGTEYLNGWFQIANDSGDANIVSPSGNISITPAFGVANAAGKSLTLQGGDADQSDFYTGTGGAVNITGGLGSSDDGGGGGPGGNVNITSGLSADPAGVAGNINITSDSKDWVFDYTGNLSFPTNGQLVMDNGDGTIGNQGDNFVISWDNEDLVLRSVAGDVDVESNTDFNIKVNYDGGAEDYLTKWVFSSNNEIINITGNSAIITEAGDLNLQGGRDTLSNGNVQITAVNNGVAVNTWTFGNDGRLTFPGTPRIDTDADNFEVQAAEAISLEANTVVNIYTDASGSTYQWQFGDDGNLYLPDTTSVIANASITLEANSTGNITGLSVNGDADANLYAHGNVKIVSDSSNTTATWTFGDDGNLTLPTGGQIIITGGLVSAGASPAPTINGFSITNSVGISGTGNISGNNISATGTLTATGKIGYASGSTVTQITSRGTGVTINAIAGTIITTSVAMVANEIDTFSVINSSVDPNNDIVLAQIVSPNQGTYNCIANPAVIGGFSNGFYINIVNISGFTTADETITIRFMVIKAPNA